MVLALADVSDAAARHALWRHLFAVPWLVVGLWWLVRAFSTERTERRESLLSRLSYLVLAIAGGVLLAGAVPGELLEARLWPRSFALAVVGLALEWVGVGFAIWARESLGRLWSGTVTLKEGHQIVKKGPYRLVRHPIYTGLLTAILGPLIARANLGALLGVALILVSVVRKIQLEERLLESRFGQEYRTYRSEVRALIPFLF